MSHLGSKDFYDREVVLKAQQERILAGIFGGLPEDEIQKASKGEGSRGGKVIGHTKSGKPIYGSVTPHKDHKGFSKDDHKEAAELLRGKQKKSTSSQKEYDYGDQAAYHERMSKEEDSPSHKDDKEESKKQKKELDEYEKKKIEKAMTAQAADKVIQKESVEGVKDDLKKAFDILGVE
jgi:hypothetical protein